MEIVQGQVGPEGKYDLKVEGGCIIVAAAYAGADAEVDLGVKFQLAHVLDKIADAYPNPVVKGAISLVKMAIAAAG